MVRRVLLTCCIVTAALACSYGGEPASPCYTVGPSSITCEGDSCYVEWEAPRKCPAGYWEARLGIGRYEVYWVEDGDLILGYTAEEVTFLLREGL